MITKCIITGGAGFIGSHLADLLLKKKFEVEIIDNLSTGRKANINHIIDKVKFNDLDLSDNNDYLSNILEDADYIFHLASLADIVPSIKYPEVYFKANVQSTLNLLKSCNPKKLKKFVYAASSSCYGISEEFPTSELSKISPARLAVKSGPPSNMSLPVGCASTGSN